MNKIWYIVIGAVTVLGIILFFVVGSGKQSSTTTPSNQNVGLPSAGSAGNSTNVTAGSTASGNVISVSSTGGGNISVTDFLSDSTTTKDPINPGFYYLGYHEDEGTGDPTASANPPYIIAYVESDKSFIINLLQEPIGAVRQEMERYLMNRLGIPQEQMCRLNYRVSVNWRLNPYFSGTNLGFSFCPGATVLPQ